MRNKGQEIDQLLNDLWESCNKLRADSHLSEDEYYEPILGIIFLKCETERFKKVREELGGDLSEMDEEDFRGRNAVKLPDEANYDWIFNLRNDNLISKNLKDEQGITLSKLGSFINYALSVIEKLKGDFRGELYKKYDEFSDEIIRNLLEIFNNQRISELEADEDVMGIIYEFFLGKFSSKLKGDEGIFFTPSSLVDMIVNVLEPQRGNVLDPACGSGGMFIGVKRYVEKINKNRTQDIINRSFAFFGHEKAKRNAKLFLMNVSIHKIDAQLKSGEESNTYYHNPFNLYGKCDYVLSNPPFNVTKVEAEKVKAKGHLPFGLPETSNGEIKNANFLWISRFYSFLSEKGKAGFVMPSITMNGTVDKRIRQEIIEKKHVDILISIAPKFFPIGFKGGCCLWFLNKQKVLEQQNKILFIDSTKYFSALNKGQNYWNKWQIKNLSAIVWLYRGDLEHVKKYNDLIQEYREKLDFLAKKLGITINQEDYTSEFEKQREKLEENFKNFSSKSEKLLKQQEQKDCNEAISIAREYHWIYSKFGDGKYKDILGLCKVVDIEEIKNNDYSLNPGSYVGAEEEEFNEEIFMNEMRNMHKELFELEEESQKLSERIKRNMSLWER